MIDIVQQPLQSIFFTEHSIGSFRNSPSKAVQRPAVCRNKFFSFSQIVTDLTSPNLVIAFAKEQRALLIFEFKGPAGRQQCSPRGILRLDDIFTQFKLIPDSIIMQSATSQLLFTFQGSTQVMYMNYNPRNLVNSILAQSTEELANNMYSVGDKPTSIIMADKQIILTQDDRQIFLFNSLQPILFQTLQSKKRD